MEYEALRKICAKFHKFALAILYGAPYIYFLDLLLQNFTFGTIDARLYLYLQGSFEKMILNMHILLFLKFIVIDF